MKTRFSHFKLLLYVVVTLSFFSATKISAQPGWAKSYGANIVSGGSKPVYTLQTYDGGFLTMSALDSTSMFSRPFIFKTASDGTLLWQQTLPGMYKITINTTLPMQLPDSGFMLVFPTPSIAGNNNDLFPTDSLTILKLDKNGNKIWQHYLSKFSFSTFTNQFDTLYTKFMNTRWASRLMSNGNILLLGNFQRMMNSSTKGWTRLGIETDTAGAVVNSTVIDTVVTYPINTSMSSANVPFRLVSSPLGFLFAERFLLNTIPYDSYALVDNAMNIVWKKVLPTNFNIDAFEFTPADSGFILVSNQLPQLIKLDKSGNVLWTSASLNIPSITSLKNVKPTADGGYIVTGATASRMILAKTDANGNMQWYSILAPTALNPEIGYNVLSTADTGYLISGTITDIITGARQVRLVKTDSLGNVTTNYISGNVFNDVNGNCTLDGGEPGIGGRIIELTPGFIYTSTDSLGDYSFESGPGTFNVKLLPYPNNLSVSCPVNGYTVTLANSYDSVFAKNFADSILIHCSDLVIHAGIDEIRPCMKSTIGIAYHNNGTDTAFNVVVNYQVNDPDIIPYSSSVPYTFILPDLYQLQIGTVPPGKSGVILIYDSVSCSAVAGSMKCMSASITPISGDCDTTNNTKNFCRSVITSYDPNDKQVESKNVSANGYVTGERINNSDELNYMIRFQNTGTDTAFSIVVVDTLSPLIDIASVQPGASSAAYSFKVLGPRVLQWTFSNINLPDSTTDAEGSHGFLAFTAKQTANNIDGAIINNAAAIIFDFNAGVLTNICSDTVQLSGSGVAMLGGNTSINIFPNPTSGRFTFNSPLKHVMLKIYNQLGETVFTEQFTDALFNEELHLNGASGMRPFIELCQRV